MSALVEAFFKKENISAELASLKLQEQEKEKLLKLADDLAELRFLDIILEKLEEKDKELFLEQIHGGTAEVLAEFLREKIEDIEEVLSDHARALEIEIIEDIRNLQGSGE